MSSGGANARVAGIAEETRMDTERVVGWWDQMQPMLRAFGLKVIGAIVVFIVGRWLIRVAAALMGSAMTRQRVDATVQHYVSFVSIALNILLVVAILGYFGVETTSFAVEGASLTPSRAPT